MVKGIRKGSMVLGMLDWGCGAGLLLFREYRELQAVSFIYSS